VLRVHENLVCGILTREGGGLIGQAQRPDDNFKCSTDLTVFQVMWREDLGALVQERRVLGGLEQVRFEMVSYQEMLVES
jgi:hypothetical protein